jgi:hypothetical protein
MLAKNEDGTEQVKGSETEKKIPPRVLQKYLKDMTSHQGRIDEVRGEMGSLTEKTNEKYTVNKKAMGWIKQLWKMTPEKLADVLDDLNYMLDASGLNDKASSAQRLPMGDGREDEEEAEDDE